MFVRRSRGRSRAAAGFKPSWRSQTGMDWLGGDGGEQLGMDGSKTARSGGSGPQVVAIAIGKQVMILSVGPTNGRGGEQPRRLAEEEVGKKTAFRKWQMNQTQRRLPRRRKTPG